MRARIAAAAAAALLLAGCAGARVTNLVSTPAAAGPPPARIAVVVTGAPLSQQAVSTQLTDDLVKRLAAAGLRAEPYAPGPLPAGDALLRVTLTRVNPGNAAERLLIGFGTGQAQLQARAVLTRQAQPEAIPLTAFDTASDTGIKPGLILPGGVALATSNAAHFVIGGGIDVAFNLRSGLARTEGQTAKAIVAQLHRYYGSAGWVWPAEAEKARS